MAESTQLSNYKTFNTNALRFSEPEERKIPNSNMTYKTVRISCVNKDGTAGDMLFETPRLFSFGLRESNPPDNPNKLNGYQFPICLYNRDGASPDQKAFVNTFNKVVDRAKEWLVENREMIGEHDLEKRDLKKLNPLYYKKGPNGKPDKSSSPVLYLKVLTSRKKDGSGGFNIVSVFEDETSGTEIDPLTILNKYCHANVCIKFEGIYIGSKIALQLKMWEAIVHPKNMMRTRFLKRKKPLPTNNITTSTSTSTTSSTSNAISDDDSSSSEYEQEPQPSSTKRVTRQKK